MWQPILSHTLRVWICVGGFLENPTRQQVRFAMGRTVCNNENSTKIQRHFFVAKCCGKFFFAKHTIKKNILTKCCLWQNVLRQDLSLKYIVEIGV